MTAQAQRQTDAIGEVRLWPCRATTILGHVAWRRELTSGLYGIRHAPNAQSNLTSPRTCITSISLQVA